MKRGKNFLIAQAFAATSLGLVAACDAGEPQSQMPSYSVTGQTNLAEEALVNTAHKRIGEDDHIFRNEHMSSADGFLKVCGEFETKSQPTTRRRYFFSLDRREYFSDFNDPRWVRACEAGWPPGQGPVG